MKNFLFCLLLSLFSISVPAQNIGIGTTSPQSALDIRGNLRAGGTGNYILFDSSTGRFSWNNSFLYLPASQYILRHSASPEGLLYTGTALMYQNTAGNASFYTEWTTGNGYFSGNLGVGVFSPAARLHVGNGHVRIDGPSAPGGAALSLSSQGEVQVDAPFIPAGRFLIKENGRVGIGVTAPSYLLDVAQRMRIRSGGNNSTSAGLWLNNNTNTEAAFLGMETDNYVGIYGTGTGWKFSMNVQNGALKVNGSEGAPGQVLQSNGSSAAPSWSNKPSVIFFNQPSIIMLEGASTSVDIPNINGQTINLLQASTVTLQFTIPLAGINGAGGGVSDGIVGIQLLDGSSNVALNASSVFSVGNFHTSQIIVIGAGALNAGTYTVRARVARQNTGVGNTYSDAGTIGGIPIQRGQLIIQIFPN